MFQKKFLVASATLYSSVLIIEKKKEKKKKQTLQRKLVFTFKRRSLGAGIFLFWFHRYPSILGQQACPRSLDGPKLTEK